MLISRSALGRHRIIAGAGLLRSSVLSNLPYTWKTKEQHYLLKSWSHKGNSLQHKLYSIDIPGKKAIEAQATRSWEPPVYTIPNRGILSVLPRPWVPYAELVRLDKPAGTIYLFFPCLFSTLLAAIHDPSITLDQILATSGLFLAGAFIMRGAGCTINDLWDQNLDPLVQRTALRPLARKAITTRAAIVFTGFQLLAGLALLLQFPYSCLYHGIPSLALVFTYPLAKRITHYPQFVLGLAFSWGAFMGFPALGISLIEDLTVMKAAVTLYGSCVLWTVLYDMIYAHMDIKDDKKAGIKSIALRHDGHTKRVLTGLSVAQVSLLVTSGYMIEAGAAYYLLACGGATITLWNMILRVNLKSVSDCWWWFRTGVWITGGTVSIGMFVEYLQTRKK
ncbi:MAG: hypothetical protein GOMPHAMPRED_007865 [Gomphillus americanus]|uniref:4-hydroxybenzoate polyprenyltransferase, mitochondrial n=1 Tax=Gomphillus americanus TaxID=1940652 RepID=A0A8H3IAB9_9LECA|nr:MAG: hypothetical protein GOMPHAMPRED_007865 [Gomphillus americanus]